MLERKQKNFVLKVDLLYTPRTRKESKELLW